MSDFYYDIELLVKALQENNIQPLTKLFYDWDLDLNSNEDWEYVQGAINEYMVNG